MLNKPGCSVQSPSYPHRYDANLTCEWVLETSADEPITVDFIDMMMYRPETGDDDCNVNYVTVYDGTTTNDNVLMERSCQKEEDEEMKVVSSGKLVFSKNVFLQTDELPYPLNKICAYVILSDWTTKPR